MRIYKGERYRDDRMFVVNLSRGTVEKGSKKTTRWLVDSYWNKPSLPPYSTAHFETREEAVEYLKKMETTTPLISNDGMPLDIPEDADTWEYWLKWVEEKGFKSAITGRQIFPERHTDRGGMPKNDYVKVIELTEEELREFDEE